MQIFLNWTKLTITFVLYDLVYYIREGTKILQRLIKENEWYCVPEVAKISCGNMTKKTMKFLLGLACHIIQVNNKQKQFKKKLMPWVEYRRWKNNCLMTNFFSESKQNIAMLYGVYLWNPMRGKEMFENNVHKILYFNWIQKVGNYFLKGFGWALPKKRPLLHSLARLYLLGVIKYILNITAETIHFLYTLNFSYNCMNHLLYVL